MNKIKFLLAVMLAFTLQLASQSLTKEQVVSSGRYFYGEGTSQDQGEASDKAYKDLVEKISVTVKSSFEHKIKENNDKFDNSVESVVGTYSQATLSNVQKIINPVDDGLNVFCYMDKNELKKIFDARKKLCYEIYMQAKEHEADNNYGNAIKYYYFVTILMNSIPEETISYNNINLTVEIPTCINRIIQNTEFLLVDQNSISKDEKSISLKVKVAGQVASYIEFSFWDGASQINATAQDGIASLKLYGASTGLTKFDFQIKYSYYECREEIKTVAELWDIIEKASFKNIKKIDLSTIKSEDNDFVQSKICSKSDEEVTAPIFTKTKKEINSKLANLALFADSNCTVIDSIARETALFINLINTKNLTKIKTVYNDEILKEKICRIIQYNKSQVLDKITQAEINKTPNGWELRRVAVMNNYASLNKQATEYLVLDFTPDGKLDDVNFSINDQTYNGFVKQGDFAGDWTNRQTILKFVEKYKTSYLNRDMETLNKIFSEDALIIIGKAIKTNPLLEKPLYTRQNESQPDYQTIQYSKQEYLKNQKKTFDGQKDIYLGFSTFNIKSKNDKKGVYGISMRQNYQSTGYADEGYLFLMIDFNEKNPQIYVRSWQPQEWEDEKLVKLSNFKVR